MNVELLIGAISVLYLIFIIAGLSTIGVVLLLSRDTKRDRNPAPASELDPSPAQPLSLLQKLVRRWKLRRQARLDYENARGTNHLRIIQSALEHIRKKQKAYKRELQDLAGRQQRLDKQRQAALVNQLHTHLVRDRLDEIKGIGPKLKHRILQQVWRGHLQDLRFAYRVDGVGETKQRAINRWMRRYQRQTPRLLEHDFPGKAATVDWYREEIRRTEHQIRQMEDAREGLRKLQIETARRTAEFSRIRKRDFVRALREKGAYPAHLERYVHGLFTPWEPMPAWFRRVIEEGRPE